MVIYKLLNDGLDKVGSTWDYGCNHQSLKVFMKILLLVIGIFFIFALSLGVDTQIKNQDIMLCQSAQKSGNQEYLEKCECYYETHDITCIRE